MVRSGKKFSNISFGISYKFGSREGNSFSICSQHLIRSKRLFALQPFEGDTSKIVGFTSRIGGIKPIKEIFVTRGMGIANKSSDLELFHRHKTRMKWITEECFDFVTIVSVFTDKEVRCN